MPTTKKKKKKRRKDKKMRGSIILGSRGKNFF